MVRHFLGACIALGSDVSIRTIRRLVATCLGILALVSLTRDAVAGGGFAPPIAIDFGSSVLSAKEGTVRTGTVLTAGLKWATIYPKRTSFDVGIGYVGTMIRTEDAKAPHRPSNARATRNTLSSMHGGFLEFSGLAAERSHARAWVSGRAELMRSNGEAVLGIATRLSAEVWTGLSHSSRGGAAYGVAALGVWTELGVRRLPSLGLVQQLSVGLSVRLPAVVSGV
jgi:hypothetical protein